MKSRNAPKLPPQLKVTIPEKAKLQKSNEPPDMHPAALPRTTEDNPGEMTLGGWVAADLTLNTAFFSGQITNIGDFLYFFARPQIFAWNP